MIRDSQKVDVAVGAAMGTTFTYGAITLGPAALASGWLPALCAGGLAASAVALIAGVEIRRWSAPSDSQRRKPHEIDDDLLQPAAQAQTPTEWMAARGACDVPEAERPAYLRAILGRALTSRPPGSGLYPDDETALHCLAYAFAARCIEGTDRAEGASSTVLRDLDLAYAATPVQQRSTAIQAIRDRCRPNAGADPRATAILDEAGSRHAYWDSLLLSLLERARKSGRPLATAEFLWLKDRSRPLYYALNNLGRRGFLVEGLAGMDHYRHEKAAGRPLLPPHVDGAVQALMGVRHDAQAEAA